MSVAAVAASEIDLAGDASVIERDRSALAGNENGQIAAEDLARARWYGFFSRWLLAVPDRQALDLYLGDHADRGRPPEQGDRLASAWHAFAAATRAVPLAALRDAYDSTFITVGQAPVPLHASVYLSGFSNERPLAEIRAWLAEHGIESRQGGLVTEDHLGLLCEVMAWLIIERPAEEAAQQALFRNWLAPVCDEFAQRLASLPEAGAYGVFGELFAAFCSIERQAFDMDQ